MLLTGIDCLLFAVWVDVRFHDSVYVVLCVMVNQCHYLVCTSAIFCTMVLCVFLKGLTLVTTVKTFCETAVVSIASEYRDGNKARF